MRINAYRTLRTSLAAVAALLLVSGLCSASQSYTVRKGDTLFLLAKRFGTTVKALQSANKISSPNQIKAGRVISIPEPAQASRASWYAYGIAKVEELEVWEGNERVAALEKGKTFGVLEKADGKFKVQLKDGTVGWVLADDITLKDTRKPVAVSDDWSVGYNVVSTAYAYRGSRYRRGGMSSGGFDCSGFVKFLYAKAGIKLPHSSRAMFSYGKPVPSDQLQPGDVVFFANTYRRGISHVGVYVGDGKFIHASTTRGGVRLDNLHHPYYRSKYVGARRPSTDGEK